MTIPALAIEAIKSRRAVADADCMSVLLSLVMFESFFARGPGLPSNSINDLRKVHYSWY